MQKKIFYKKKKKYVELLRKVSSRVRGVARLFDVCVVTDRFFACVSIDFEVIVHRYEVYIEVYLSLDECHLLFRSLIDSMNLKFPKNGEVFRYEKTTRTNSFQCFFFIFVLFSSILLKMFEFIIELFFLFTFEFFQ